MRFRSPDIDETPSPVPDGVAVQRPERMSVIRRRLLWIVGLVVVLLLLVFTPPLVNANRYRGRIAETMSKSLGRPVHLDNVSLHLLPVPGFTLQNFVVSESPEFGAEPTIRANTVEATLRVSSLWHHPVEFSTVRFVEPSVNLVRNAQGHWNLADVLLHAAHVQSAPTVQKHAGPTPRFPYIEATGGRVNVKFGAEKLPFSLSDADFALWLPSSQQWKVRLLGQPSRTDINITDPGRIRIEGELRQAASAATVPVNFTASWHDAPLGEASRILTGNDWGWRGSLNVDATLSGTLGEALLASKLTLGGLRRAEFFPSRPLDLQATCSSGFSLHPAALTQLRCGLPDDAPEPLLLQADTVHLQGMQANIATVKGEAIPARWALLWVALFSSRVPTDLHPAGTLDVDLTHRPAPLNAPVSMRPVIARRHSGRHAPDAPVVAGGGWSGSVQFTLPAPVQADASLPSHNSLLWTASSTPGNGGWPTLHLPATHFVLGPSAAVTVASQLNQGGYTLSVNGEASAAALLVPARYLPQLGDGLEKVLPYPPTGTEPGRVQFTCTHLWGAAQSCTGQDAAVPAHSAVLPMAGNQPARHTPSELSPRNLSPLENAPFNTPRNLSPQP